MECFKVENLNFAYPNRTNKALMDINFTVGQGVWFYLPFLLIAGTVAGAFIGLLCFAMLSKTKNIIKYI